MARIGISITKSCLFRQATQEFSNVYHYESSAGIPTPSEADAMIDQVKAAEIPFHSTAVTFVRGRLWTQEGSPGANEMIAQKNLSGTGSTTQDTSLDRERAFLAFIRAGQDSRGKPVYLRKWYHSCGNGPGATSTAGGIAANTSPFSAAQQNAVGAAVSAISPIGTGGEVWSICSKNGRTPTAGFAWTGHRYLEHHQLGDMWRAQ